MTVNPPKPHLILFGLSLMQFGTVLWMTAPFKSLWGAGLGGLIVGLGAALLARYARDHQAWIASTIIAAPHLTQDQVMRSVSGEER